MDCGKHKKMIVLHAFSYGKCKVCEKDIMTPHIPCNVVCDDCSKEKKLCKICGDNINKGT